MHIHPEIMAELDWEQIAAVADYRVIITLDSAFEQYVPGDNSVANIKCLYEIAEEMQSPELVTAHVLVARLRRHKEATAKVVATETYTETVYDSEAEANERAADDVARGLVRALADIAARVKSDHQS